jgi:large subunit ribosomal protein L21
MSPSYAIVESGGKQYRAEKGESLLVDRLLEDEGSKVSLRAVMYRGDKKVVIDGGELDKVKVEAVVAEHLRGPKLRVFKYRAKKGYRRRAGHRSELTRLEVTDVRLLTRKPAAQNQATEKPAEKPEAQKAATSKRTTRKQPAKKPTARKQPAKKRTSTRKGSATARKSPSGGRSSAKKES